MLLKYRKNMNQVSEQYNAQEIYEDEISLKDLFHNIWRTRVTWVASLLIVTMLFWGVWGIFSLIKPNVKTFGLAANLTFENIDKGLYPNETPFYRSDITTSSVLKKVYADNKIGQYGVLSSEFVQMINVLPYAPDIEAIELKYEKKLANSKKMTPQDIDLIQSQKNEEILAASQRGVLVQLTELNVNQIPENVIKKVLLDIYKTWAYKAINERNVLKTDIDLLSSITVENSLVNELDYSIALDFVKDKMNVVKDVFEQILELPNSKTITDPETGLTILDMSRSLDDRLKYQLRLIEAPIVQLGITRYPDLTNIYYLEELYLLKEKSNMLDLKAKATQQTLERYSVQYNTNSNGAVVTQSSMSPQFSGDFLDKIISLSGESTDTLYKQELASEVLKYKQEKTDVIVELRALERKIAALSSIPTEDTVTGANVKESTIKLLNKRIPDLLHVLSGYLEASKRIYELLDKKALSGNGALYQLTGEGITVSGGYFDSIKSWIMVYFILLLLTTIVVVPWKMIKNAE